MEHRILTPAQSAFVRRRILRIAKRARMIRASQWYRPRLTFRQRLALCVHSAQPARHAAQVWPVAACNRAGIAGEYIPRAEWIALAESRELETALCEVFRKYGQGWPHSLHYVARGMRI